MYGPADAKASNGEDPSVHDIVQSLGVLDDVPGFRSDSPGFRFREPLASPPPHIKSEIASSLSGSERRTSDSSIDSDMSAMDGASCFSGHSTTAPPSPTQSVSSLNAIITSTLSLTASNNDPAHPQAAQAQIATTTTFRAQRPDFLSLPPRPNLLPPTIPWQTDFPTPTSFADVKMAAASGAWLPEDMRWAYASMAPSYDQEQGSAQFTDGSWGTWTNEPNEYDNLSREFDVWLSLLPNGR